ncbi:MAG: histidinol-phosphate transaminase [Campylobacterales bacterium]
MRFKKELDNIKVYEAGKPIELVVREFGVHPENIIKMASNENPYGTPKRVIDTIVDRATHSYRYPDDSMFELKDKLSKKFSVSEKNIIIGAGSDQIIDFAIKSKCHKDSKILTAGVTFAMYEIYARHVGARVIKTPSKEHNIEEFKELYKKEQPEIVFLCLPNNPLGDSLDASEVEEFIKITDPHTLVVLDGAYQEYASTKDAKKRIDPKYFIEKYPNILYLGTFSKAYGLGGLRVGYGIARENIIEALMKLRPPFNITNISLAAAIVALDEYEFIETSIKENFSQMTKFEKFLTKIGLKYIQSYTNFITILFSKEDSTQISDILLKEGIIVRNLASYGINGIRVTIDRPKNNERFLQRLEQIISLED